MYPLLRILVRKVLNVLVLFMSQREHDFLIGVDHAQHIHQI